MRYRYHVFVCTNQKAPGKACCGEERGMALVQLMKQLVRDKGLQAEVRVQRTGCLDVCHFGPGLVVYPEGTFYGHVTPEIAAQLVEQHLVNNQPMNDAILRFPLPPVNS